MAEQVRVAHIACVLTSRAGDPDRTGLAVVRVQEGITARGGPFTLELADTGVWLIMDGENRCLVPLSGEVHPAVDQKLKFKDKEEPHVSGQYRVFRIIRKG